MAVAPGIATFVAGAVYEHGGISPQECVTPVITVRAAAAPRSPVVITIAWRGLRADVAAAGAPSGASVDLRRKAGDPTTSLIAGPVILTSDATARILVVLEDAIGAAAFLVVVAEGGGVIAQETVTVGGEG